jgi:hypothetical protein
VIRVLPRERRGQRLEPLPGAHIILEHPGVLGLGLEPLRQRVLLLRREAFDGA